MRLILFIFCPKVIILPIKKAEHHGNIPLFLIYLYCNFKNNIV